MHEANTDIKTRMKAAGVRQWQIANVLGISENTLVRKLRYPLDSNEKQRIAAAIRELEKKDR